MTDALNVRHMTRGSQRDSLTTTSYFNFNIPARFLSINVIVLPVSIKVSALYPLSVIGTAASLRPLGDAAEIADCAPSYRPSCLVTALTPCGRSDLHTLAK